MQSYRKMDQEFKNKMNGVRAYACNPIIWEVEQQYQKFKVILR